MRKLVFQQSLRLKRLERHRESEAIFEELVRQAPTDSDLWSNLGEVRKARGHLVEALEAFRRAIALPGADRAAHGNLLLLLHYIPGLGREEIAAAHRRYGERFDAPRPQEPGGSHPNDPDPERPLRIGYLSPDVRRHAAARFIEPLLLARDRKRFTVLLYGEVAAADGVSERLIAAADGWRCTVGRSAGDVARMVRDDRIDLLVDLAGHTAGNRLDGMALRPAPLQLTTLGYPDTTGMTSIDYRLTDAVLDPPGEERYSSETLLRLGGSFACFQPPAAAPEIADPPPRAADAPLRLVSPHQIFKLNGPLLELWSRVLDALPGARLVFLRHSFTKENQQEMRRRLRAHGIDPRRAEFQRPIRHDRAYMELLAGFDVMLDAFPHCGHTTSCEALWMGVPVVTLRGEAPCGRLTASVLEAIGRSEWIAADPEAYVAAVVALGRDPRALRQARADLRERMRRTVCNGPRFMEGLEAIYRRLWRQWCGERAGPLQATHQPGPAAATSPAATTAASTDPWRDVPTAQLTSRGLERIRAGRAAEALPYFERVSEREPLDARAWFNLGNLLQSLGRSEDAAAAHRRTVELDPQLRRFLKPAAQGREPRGI
jgi:Flp pilus assembly protein TadD